LTGAYYSCIHLFRRYDQMAKKVIIPTPIKFSFQQRRFLKREAKKAGHGHLSKVVKQLVDDLMAKEQVA